jgi:hypothetical protein
MADLESIRDGAEGEVADQNGVGRLEQFAMDAGVNTVIPGEYRVAMRGKGIHSVKNQLNLHEMDSLPLAAFRRSAGNDSQD